MKVVVRKPERRGPRGKDAATVAELESFAGMRPWVTCQCDATVTLTGALSLGCVEREISVPAVKAGDMVVVTLRALAPAGWMVGAAYSVSDGTVRAAFYGPALALGASAVFQLRFVILRAP